MTIESDLSSISSHDYCVYKTHIRMYICAVYRKTFICNLCDPLKALNLTLHPLCTVHVSFQNGQFVMQLLLGFTVNGDALNLTI